MITRILLAEDDRGTALLVKTQLENKGYSVFTAGNGLEALKILSSQSIDLLITDVVMPKMDGVDLYAAVKKDPKTCNIPIIIVTDKAVFKESFTSLGVSNFVEKSSDVNVLFEKIKTIEGTGSKSKSFPKILINSNENAVVEQIKNALTGMDYLILTAKSSDAILSNAITTKPNAIVLDVLFHDTASAPELIRAIRCFSSLAQTKIITYAFFPEELGINVDSVEALKIAMAQCTDAGADLYIGRFNQAFFLEKLYALGIWAKNSLPIPFRTNIGNHLF